MTDVSIAGIRPSKGGIHLGHLIGNIEPVLNKEDKTSHFFLLSDSPALNFDKDRVAQITDMTAEIICCGTGLERCKFVLQSQLTQNLLPFFMLIASNVTKSRLERLPAIKNMMSQNKITFTLSDYFFPLIEVVDILSLNAKTVFANSDNKPFVELTREIVRKINHNHCGLLVEPKLENGKVPFLVGTDGKKMSKSKNNCIFISDNNIVLEKKIKKMYTDPNRVRANIPSNPNENPVYIYHTIFNPNKVEVDNMRYLYETGSINDSDAKARLFEILSEQLSEKRERAFELKKSKKNITEKILLDTRHANALISKNLNDFFNNISFNFK